MLEWYGAISPLQCVFETRYIAIARLLECCAGYSTGYEAETNIPSPTPFNLAMTMVGHALFAKGLIA